MDLRATPTRIHCVRGALLLTVALALVPAGGSSAGSSLARAHGLALPLPPGWHAVTARLTDCSDPAQRLAIAGDGALVVLQERLSGERGRGSTRLRRFRVSGSAKPMECCAVLSRAGWMFAFVDRGRGLYAYVYPGHPGSTATALRTLDRLDVSASGFS
jgi:hypothetical protein